MGHGVSDEEMHELNFVRAEPSIPFSWPKCTPDFFRHSIYASDKEMHVPCSEPNLVLAKPFVSNFRLKCVLIQMQGHLVGNSCGCVLVRIVLFERVMYGSLDKA